MTGAAVPRPFPLLPPPLPPPLPCWPPRRRCTATPASPLACWRAWRARSAVKPMATSVSIAGSSDASASCGAPRTPPTSRARPTCARAASVSGAPLPAPARLPAAPRAPRLAIGRLVLVGGGAQARCTEPLGTCAASKDATSSSARPPGRRKAALSTESSAPASFHSSVTSLRMAMSRERSSRPSSCREQKTPRMNSPKARQPWLFESQKSNQPAGFSRRSGTDVWPFASMRCSSRRWARIQTKSPPSGSKNSFSLMMPLPLLSHICFMGPSGASRALSSSSSLTGSEAARACSSAAWSRWSSPPATALNHPWASCSRLGNLAGFSTGARQSGHSFDLTHDGAQSPHT
mmetsp:Transcript_79647/g.204897  ORF Transcript_79647/g.204897 Transcript_79647/m.204897 type:complete len:348 (-) Transcript_79647:1596-2639(-)